MFQRNILPPSSRSASTPSKQHHDVASKHSAQREPRGEGRTVTTTAPEKGHICRSRESWRVTGATGRAMGDEGREKRRNGCRENLNVESAHSSEMSVNFCQLHGITFQQIVLLNGKAVCHLGFSYAVPKQCNLLSSMTALYIAAQL
jgi:hypothetical protein